MYLHRINIILFIIPPATEQAKYHACNMNTGRVSLFGYVIYSAAEAVCVTCRTNNIAKKANLGNTGAREVKLDSSDGRGHGEYTGVGSMEISFFLARQGTFSFGSIYFNEVYLGWLQKLVQSINISDVALKR